MIALLRSQRGGSLVAAMLVMVVMGVAAASVVNLSGSDSKQMTDNMQSTQALAVGTAGLQWALDRLNEGQDPSVQDKSFSPGSFSVVANALTSSLTSTGQVGSARKSQTISANFSRNCVDLVVSNSTVNGASVENIQLIKTCNGKAIVDKVYLTWNWSECAVGVQCDGSNAIDDVAADEDEAVVYEDVGDPGQNKIWICHVPPGNPENRQSLSVSMSGWLNGHKAGTGDHHNMDYLGPCIIDNAGDEPEVNTCQGTSSSSDALGFCVTDDGGAQLTTVELNNESLFNSGVIPEGSESTSSGVITDVQDGLLEADGTYTIDITLDTNITVGAWFSVTVYFLDGSQLTGVFKAGNVAP